MKLCGAISACGKLRLFRLSVILFFCVFEIFPVFFVFVLYVEIYLSLWFGSLLGKGDHVVGTVSSFLCNPSHDKR